MRQIEPDEFKRGMHPCFTRANSPHPSRDPGRNRSLEVGLVGRARRGADRPAAAPPFASPFRPSNARDRGGARRAVVQKVTMGAPGSEVELRVLRAGVPPDAAESAWERVVLVRQARASPSN